MGIETRAYVRRLLSTESLDSVIKFLDTLPDNILNELDSTSGASVLFFAVQRQPGHEALALAHYFCEQRGVCNAATADNNDQTALFFAARDGNAECVRYLVSQGCDPTHLDSAGQTALFYACRDGRTNIVKLLAEEMNVDLNLQDKAGQTALFYAARDGQLETVKYMLTQAVDVSILDWQKKNACWYAQKKGHYDLAAFLKVSIVEKPSEVSIPPRPGKRRTTTSPACLIVGPEEIRNKTRLQYRVPLPSGNQVWLYADSAHAQKFEDEFPHFAVWDKQSAPTTYEPVGKLTTTHPKSLWNQTDAFRVEWVQLALQVIDLVSNCQDGWLFKRPVNIKTWNCPDYYQVIKEPRDFSMIRKKLRNLEYRSIHTFTRDMELVFLNCYRYNPDTTDVHQAGKRVEKFFRSVSKEKKIDKWLNLEDELVQYLLVNSLPVSIGVQAEIPELQAQIQPGGQTQIQPGGQTQIQPGGQAVVQPGGQTQIQPGGQTQIQPGGQTQIQPGGQTQIQPGGQAEISGPQPL